MKYAVARQGDYKVIIVLDTKEEAEKLIAGKENYCEIREVKDNE